MSTSAEGTPVDFSTDLAALRQDVTRLTATMSGIVQHQKQAAGRRVYEVAEEAREKLANTAAGAQHRVCAAGSSIGTGIERHPLVSALLALGIGMSIGLLSRSRD